MENLVSITNTKENTIEFDLSIEGLDINEMDVRLIVETKDVNLSFDAEKKDGDTWCVTVPPLSILERTAYNYCIEVITDGYHFKPTSGTINVQGTAELYTSAPKNSTLETTKAGEKKEKKTAKKAPKPTTESKRTKAGERPIAEITQELMEGKGSGKKVEKKTAKSSQPTAKDERVLAILEEVGYTPKSKRKGRRISFVTTKPFSS